MWPLGSKSYLGVDLGAGGVKIVQLKREKNRPVLFTYGFTTNGHDTKQFLQKPPELAMVPGKMGDTSKAPPLFVINQEDVAKYAAIIKAVCKQAKISSKSAVASLPVSSVFHAVVTLPIVKKEEFDRILRAEIKKLLPYSIEEMVFDSQILPPESDTQTQRVLVNAVPKALVAFYTQVFKLSGLELESLEPESTALSRALIGRDNAITLVVDVGAQRTNLFIIDKTVPMTHQSIDFGGDRIRGILVNDLGVESDLGEQIKKDLFDNLLTSSDNLGMKRDHFFNLFSPVITPLLKEIDDSISLYNAGDTSNTRRPEKIILTGGGAALPYLSEIISDKFKIKCYIGDPWGRVVYQDSLRPLLREIAPRMAVAIGLALKNVV